MNKGCQKGENNAKEGGVAFQKFKAIYIHPDAQCCFAELAAYSYKTDDSDNPTTDIEDKNNHYADALRYAIEPIVRPSNIVRVRRL